MQGEHSLRTTYFNHIKRNVRPAGSYYIFPILNLGMKIILIFTGDVLGLSLLECLT